MNRHKFLLRVSLLLLIAVGAQAQYDQTRIGFGVGLGKQVDFYSFYFLASEDFSIFTMPIDFSNLLFIYRTKSIRFEPNFGFFNYSLSETGDYGESYSLSNLRIGALIALTSNKGSIDLYYGVGFGVSLFFFRDSSSYSYYEPDSETFLSAFVGPAVGGEYIFGDHFSLGGEIQVNLISPSLIRSIESEISQYIISSRGNVIVRWYIK